MEGRLALGTASAAFILAFSGCVGANDETPSTSALPPSGGPGNAAALYRFEGVDGYFQSMLEEGSFPTCAAGLCGHQAVIDFSDLIPARTPTAVRAEIEWDSPDNPGGLSYAVADLDYGDAEIYRQSSYSESSSTATSSGGTAYYELLVTKGMDPVAIRLNRANPGGEISWSVSVEVKVNSTWIPSSVAVELRIATGQTLNITFEDVADDATLLLYDPEDRLFASVPAQAEILGYALPEGSADGLYVLYLRSAQGNYSIESSNATDPMLRPLPFGHSIGDFRPVTGADAVEWQFDVPKTPLYVGMYVLFQTGTVAVFVPFNPWTGTAFVSSPEGVVVEREVSFTCGTGCYTSAAFAASDFGDPRLVPGTYTARYAPNEPQALSVAELVFHYER